MNTLSFLWQLLTIFISILSTYFIFKYLLDRYLLKNNPKKIKIPTPLRVLYLLFCYTLLVSFLIRFYLSESSRAYELIEILTLRKIDNLIFAFFWTSMAALAAMFFSVNLNQKTTIKSLDKLIIFILIFLPLARIILGFGLILSNNILMPLSALSIDLKTFLIYRLFVLPGMYLLSSLIFLFAPKRKWFSTEDYDKKRKIMYTLKNSLIFFYLIFMICMIYFKLKYVDFFYNEGSFLFFYFYEIILNTFLFIIIYIGLSYYVSEVNNKIKLFGDLLRKTCLFLILSLFILAPLPIVWYKLKELGINITLVIITAILITITTYIINTITNRFFK